MEFYNLFAKNCDVAQILLSFETFFHISLSSFEKVFIVVIITIVLKQLLFVFTPRKKTFFSVEIQLLICYIHSQTKRNNAFLINYKFL